MVQTEDSIDGELRLCGRMARSLAHIVRGDLAVIQNDLSYLGTIISPDEIERSRNRCAQAAATVNKLSILSEGISKALCSLEEVVAFFGADLSDSAALEKMVMIDRSSITKYITIIKDLFGPWRATASLNRQSGGVLLIKLTSESQCIVPTQYAAWHTFASAEKGERMVLDGCIADLVMRSYGWSVVIEDAKPHLRATLRIPVSEKGAL